MPESFATRLNDYLSAAYPILAVETHEEMRVVSEIRSVVANRTWRKEEPPKRSGGQPTYVTMPVSYAEWDSVSGMIRIPLVQSAGAEVQAINGSKEPPLALNQIKTFQEPTVVVMKDIHPFIEVPSVWRTLRNIIGTIKESGVTIIFISPRLKIAAEIAKEVQVVEYRMPSRDELALAFRNYVETNIVPKPGYEELVVDPAITEAVAEASMGMTSAEADNAFALATIASARKTKKVKFDQDFVRGIFEEKIANLKNSALEYKATHAGFESVGGLEAVKAWSMRRRQGFSEEARKLRLPYPKGVLLAGIKGCIDGDAEIQVNRAGKGFRVRLRDFWLRFNRKDRSSKNNWDTSIKTYVRALCGHDIRLHEVVEVLAKGDRPVVKLVLESGKTLRLTPDHEVAVPGNQYGSHSMCAVGALRKGDFVLVNGNRSYIDADGYVRVYGMKGHPRAQKNGTVFEHILVMEKVLGRPIRSNERVHHKNDIKHDNRPDNLAVLSESEHAKEHKRFRNLHGGRKQPTSAEIVFSSALDRVVSIRPDGVTDVYDLVMKDPYRNFVAAGVIVHNCGKTTVAQAIAHQFGFPLFMLDIGKLFASKVGETEALTREAIRLMESLGRAVVLIDELEKSLGSSATSGGGDSGTSSRMFGTLVSWMSLKTCPVFIIGTLNNFEVLPSELIRKGRFDEVWWVDLPTSEERMAIFNALLQHKFKLTSFKVEEAADPLIEATRDFSGAEIEAVIEEALYGLLEDPKADVSKLLMSAAKNITPQAQIDPASVERLREKAKSFKPASVTEVKPIALAPRGKRKVSLGE